MNSKPVKTTIAAMAIAMMLAAVGFVQTRPAPSGSGAASQAAAKPLLLEKDEGERRIWREPDHGDFWLKAGPKNNGSERLVFGAEDMVPGDEFPRHQHLAQDEILWIAKGTLHVRLGDQERDLHAGGMVFIPARTWVNVKNVGTDTASVVFAFSAPGFDDYMRCESVLPNEKPSPISPQRDKECEHLGHVVYKDLEENPKK